MTVVDDSAMCLQHAQQQQHQQQHQQQQQQQQQSWMHCDTSTLAQLPSASFDIVLSCMYARGSTAIFIRFFVLFMLNFCSMVALYNYTHLKQFAFGNALAAGIYIGTMMSYKRSKM